MRMSGLVTNGVQFFRRGMTKGGALGKGSLVGKGNLVGGDKVLAGGAVSQLTPFARARRVHVSLVAKRHRKVFAASDLYSK